MIIIMVARIAKNNTESVKSGGGGKQNKDGPLMPNKSTRVIFFKHDDYLALSSVVCCSIPKLSVCHKLSCVTSNSCPFSTAQDLWFISGVLLSTSSSSFSLLLTLVMARSSNPYAARTSSKNASRKHSC